MYDENIEWESFYRSYIRTYLERDVSELINVKNLLKFNNFMKCLAARTGELVNSDAIARDVGVSVKTIQVMIHKIYIFTEIKIKKKLIWSLKRMVFYIRLK